MWLKWYSQRDWSSGKTLEHFCPWVALLVLCPQTSTHYLQQNGNKSLQMHWTMTHSVSSFISYLILDCLWPFFGESRFSTRCNLISREQKQIDVNSLFLMIHFKGLDNRKGLQPLSLAQAVFSYACAVALYAVSEVYRVREMANPGLQFECPQRWLMRSLWTKFTSLRPFQTQVWKAWISHKLESNRVDQRWTLLW